MGSCCSQQQQQQKATQQLETELANYRKANPTDFAVLQLEYQEASLRALDKRSRATQEHEIRAKIQLLKVILHNKIAALKNDDQEEL